MTKISLTVEKLEENRAFLKDAKGRLIVWPRDFLPATAFEREIIIFETKEDGKNEINDELPKKILNEILLNNNVIK